jgi:hypothetical protein
VRFHGFAKTAENKHICRVFALIEHFAGFAWSKKLSVFIKISICNGLGEIRAENAKTCTTMVYLGVFGPNGGQNSKFFFLSFLCFLWWDGPLCASINAKTRQMCLRVAGAPAHASRQNDKNKHICLVFAFIENVWRYRAKRVSYYSIWRCLLAKAGYILRMGYYSYRGDTPRRSQ